MRAVEFSVKGVTFDGRQGIIARLTGREPLRIIPEPDNKFDANALGVNVALDGEIKHVGYVPKERAAEIAPHLDGETVDGQIIDIVGGYISGGRWLSYGLVVRFEFPDETTV
jgi:hypothetical protein